MNESPAVGQRYSQVQKINTRLSSVSEFLVLSLLRCMPELMPRPKTLILELQTTMINSMVKYKGISKQEQAVITNQADPGLSKSKEVVAGM